MNDDDGHVVGLNLQNFGTGVKCDLPASLHLYDCAGSTYRSEQPGGCRHQVALWKALANRPNLAAQSRPSRLGNHPPPANLEDPHVITAVAIALYVAFALTERWPIEHGYTR